jgi:hypothetical protein
MSAAVAFLLMLPELLAAQDLTSSIVGTWKLTSFARKELATGKTAATYGEHPTGYAYYTKGGHFLIFGVAQDRKKNEKIAAPTDAERVELFKSNLGGLQSRQERAPMADKGNHAGVGIAFRRKGVQIGPGDGVIYFLLFAERDRASRPRAPQSAPIVSVRERANSVIVGRAPRC